MATSENALTSSASWKPAREVLTKWIAEVLVIREGEAVDDGVELVTLRLDCHRKVVDIGLLLDVARVEGFGAEFFAQLLDRWFCAIVLVGEQQRSALAGERLRDRIRYAPFIPHTKNNCSLAFQ